MSTGATQQGGQGNGESSAIVDSEQLRRDIAQISYLIVAHRANYLYGKGNKITKSTRIRQTTLAAKALAALVRLGLVIETTTGLPCPVVVEGDLRVIVESVRHQGLQPRQG